MQFNNCVVRGVFKVWNYNLRASDDGYRVEHQTHSVSLKVCSMPYGMTVVRSAKCRSVYFLLDITQYVVK